MIWEDEQHQRIKQRKGKNTATARHADLGQETYRVQQSQKNMSPVWQELLFASTELINDGCLTGSGSRWVLSPWLPVLVSSLQEALANVCTLGCVQTWVPTRNVALHNPWQTTQHEGERVKISSKQEEKTFRINARKKSQIACFRHVDDSLYYDQSLSGLDLWGFKR